MAKQNEECVVRIPCRIGFPDLFTPRAFDQSKPESAQYGVTVMIPKGDEASVAAVRSAMNAAYKDLWKDKGPKLGPDKVCLRDGAEKENEINHGYWLVSAKSKRRPVVVNRRREPVQESDGLVYGGADANVVLRIWAMDNDFGKRLCASLEAVQVLGTGEPFGAPPIDPMTAFDDVEGGGGGQEAGGWQP